MISRAMTVLSDERLANMAAAGSDPAFATLYNRYSGTLFAYCRSITRNPDDGWDALQNAMIKVLVALRRSPDRTAPIRPWLFCICHNEAIGVLRRRSAAERVAGAATCTVVPGADDEALVREVVSEVVRDVQELPTGQRAALVMRELADLQYDEIAVALSTTEGNARQLVFAARAGLRDSRAGRGLPCESVRDQLSMADGRLLRRRSVRAHLRTCDGCREYASTVRRRAGQPVPSLGAWTPLAGYQMLESVFRAAATNPAIASLASGGSSLFSPLAAKAAAATVVLAAGFGAADVATMKSASDGGAKPDVPAKTAQKAATSKPSSVAAVKPSPAGAASAHVVPAVYRPKDSGSAAVRAEGSGPAGRPSSGSVRQQRTASGTTQRHSSQDQSSSGTTKQDDPPPRDDEQRAARPQTAERNSNCDQQHQGGAAQQQQQAPPQDQAGGGRRDLTYTGVGSQQTVAEAPRPPRPNDDPPPVAAAR